MELIITKASLGRRHSVILQGVVSQTTIAFSVTTLRTLNLT
jgi:hypothetical protein